MTLRAWTLAAVVALGSASCASSVDVDKVPVGTRVEVTRQDGGVVTGTLASRNDAAVRIDAGQTTRSISRREIADIRLIDEPKARPLPALAKFREVTVPAGTRLRVSLDERVGSDSSREGDPVSATLTEPVSDDGVELLPAGSVVKGHVTSAEKAGKVKGRASISLEFQTIVVGGRDDSYPIAASLSRTAAADKGGDAEKIGGSAAGGAIIGALIGGKKGAAIGAAAGGGAGTAVVLSTAGDPIELPRGTTVLLRLERPVDVKLAIIRR